MNGSRTVELIGGPLDGEVRAIQEPVYPTLKFAGMVRWPRCITYVYRRCAGGDGQRFYFDGTEGAFDITGENLDVYDELIGGEE